MSSLTDRQMAPRISTKEMQAMFAENTNDFGFGVDATRKMQLAQQAGEGMVKGVDGNIGDAIHNTSGKEEEKRKIRNTRLLASNSVIISDDVYDELINFVDQEREQLQATLVAKEAEIKAVTEEIAVVDGELETARDESHVAGVHAMRNADALSMAKLREIELRRNLEDNIETMREARRSGDPEQISAAQEALSATRTDLIEIEATILAGMSEADRHAEILRRQQEKMIRIQARRADLDENLARLENDVTNIKGRLTEYDEFAAFLRSDEVQTKLENGTLTLEDLERGGMPADMAARLQGQELTADNIRSSLVDGYKGLGQETFSALQDEDKAYVDTSYDSYLDAAYETVADTLSDTYDTLKDGANYVITGVSGFLTGEPEPTGDRVGTTAANADGRGITGATPPSTQFAFTAAVTPSLGHPAQEKQFVVAPAPEMRV